METFSIDLSPILSTVVQILFGLVLTIGTWALGKLATRLGLEADDKVRGYLETALQSGVAFAREKALLAGQDFSRIEVRNQAVATAANYVISRVPDAVTKFGITDESLNKMIQARLGGF